MPNNTANTDPIDKWFEGSAKALGQIVILVLLIAGLYLVIIFGPEFLIQQDIASGQLDANKAVGQVNEYRKTVIQTIGGVVIAFGLYLTWRRIRSMEKTVLVAEQGQITDRFSKAVEQLGDERRLAVRLGGIFALERIAKDSKDDHRAVMEVLSAFIRNNSKISKDDTAEPEIEDNGISIPSDIQAAITAIGRRKLNNEGVESYINLVKANLHGANLPEANLSRVKLRRANLHGGNLLGANLSFIDLRWADLQGTNFQFANLHWADLRWANLEGADLKGVNLEGADLRWANLKGANLEEAKLRRAFLQETNLQGVKFKGAHLQGANLQGANLEKTNIRVANNYLGAVLDEELRKSLNER